MVLIYSTDKYGSAHFRSSEVDGQVDNKVKYALKKAATLKTLILVKNKNTYFTNRGLGRVENRLKKDIGLLRELRFPQ